MLASAMSAPASITSQEFTIRPAAAADLPRMRPFLAAMIARTYPELSAERIGQRLLSLESDYLRPEAVLLGAFASSGEVLGSLALRPWDGRIALLADRYRSRPTTEMERVYVAPDLRGRGLGTALVRAGEEFARARGFAIICLHTHHFLPGALSFWLKQGFVVVTETADSWQTVFMEKSLPRS